MQKIQDKLELLVERIRSKWKIHAVILTGSYAAQNETPFSDIDVVIIGSDTENASVTITKAAPTGDAIVVRMKLAVNNAGNPPEEAVTDSMNIYVYDVTIPEIPPVVIEDFDGYADTAELLVNWSTGGDATLTLEEIHNSMQFDYSGTSDVTLSVSPAQNWIATGMDTFVVSLIGCETNDAAKISLISRCGSQDGFMGVRQRFRL